MTTFDTNQRNADGTLKPMVEGVNACVCSTCGNLGRTNRPRPGFRCVKCFIVADLGRPLQKGDITIVRKKVSRG